MRFGEKRFGETANVDSVVPCFSLTLISSGSSTVAKLLPSSSLTIVMMPIATLRRSSFLGESGRGKVVCSETLQVVFLFFWNGVVLVDVDVNTFTKVDFCI